MTGAEDATMSEEQGNLFNGMSLKVDVSRRVCGKNMLDVCCVHAPYDEYIVQKVKPGNEFQFSACTRCCSGKFAIVVCCAEVLFLPSFPPVGSVLHAEWSTERTTEPDTAQTERVLTRLVDTASLDSRLHQSSKRVSPQHPCDEIVPSCVVLARVARTTLRGSWVHTSRMEAELLVALR